MTQPSGRVLGFRSKYNFAVRISPVVCAVSAISTLVELLYRMCILRSVEKAFLAIAAHRFKSEEGDTESDGEFTNLRRNSVFRVGFFVLGALPQAVVLYACKGIPWAQGCCTAYLASFVVDEVVLYFSSSHIPSELSEYDDPVPIDRLYGRATGVVRKFCGFFGTEFFLCISGLLFHFYLFCKEASNNGIRIWYPGVLISGIALPCYVSESLNWAIYTAGLFPCFGFAKVVAKPFRGWWNILVFSLSMAGLVLLNFLAIVLEQVWAEDSGLRSERPPLVVNSLLHHGVSFLTYLGFGYYSQGTNQPSWTNWLG